MSLHVACFSMAMAERFARSIKEEGGRELG
jgi:hypothetical protein